MFNKTQHYIKAEPPSINAGQSVGEHLTFISATSLRNHLYSPILLLVFIIGLLVYKINMKIKTLVSARRLCSTTCTDRVSTGHGSG